MRPSLLLIAAASTAFAQPFSVGVKAGLPLRDFFRVVNTGTFGYFSTTNPYVVGPMAELRLPFGLGVEVDALYRHYGFSGIPGSVTTGAWEFPLLGKYKFKTRIIHPYVEAGVAWDKLSGLTEAIKSVVQTSTVHENVTHGFVFGGGVEVKALIIRITPEVRFTR